MLPKRSFHLLAAVLLLPLLVSCADSGWEPFWHGPRTPAIIGDWVASGPGMRIRLHLDDDGSFTATMNGKSDPSVWGVYRLMRNEITMHYTGGIVPDECKSTGVYHYRINGETLRFQLMDDNCLARMTVLALEWRRIEPEQHRYSD